MDPLCACVMVASIGIGVESGDGCPSPPVQSNHGYLRCHCPLQDAQGGWLG